MQALVERIGVPLFMQLVIEGWNSVFLAIMVIVMLIGSRQMTARRVETHDSVFLTNEIIIFYISIFLYNLFDILGCVATGDTGVTDRRLMRAAVFGYYLMGGFLTLFFLEIVKRQIADRNGLPAVGQIVRVLQLLHIPALLLLAATPLTGALYDFDAKNYYHRGPLYGVWYFTELVALVFITAAVICYHKKMNIFLKQVFACAAMIPLVAFLFNFTYIGVSWNSISVSVTALVIFVLYEKNKFAVLADKAIALEKAQTQLAESRLALEQSKNEALMAQIQPHFITNSLMAIRARCYDYPEVYESITNFARYLRSNFEALGDTRLILFEQEMTNIEAYLALERQNFGERLTVDYDIDCDDFLIPALSVQPLVENAVRHGVATYEKGGTVRISAHRADGRVIVEVSDRGEGRSSMTAQQQRRKGIGVTNVRARLQSMMDGTLEMTVGDRGTTATITVADRRETGENI